MKRNEIILYIMCVILVFFFIQSEIQSVKMKKEINEFHTIKEMYYTVDSYAMVIITNAEIKAEQDRVKEEFSDTSRLDSYILFQLQQDAIHLSGKDETYWSE